MPRKHKKRLGDCYEAAGKYILDRTNRFLGKGSENEAEGLVLVHAEVAGQGPLEGRTFGHAFVLDTRTDQVIDVSNGNDIRLPRQLYFALGRIDNINNYHTYDPEQMTVNILKFKHWGPWDLQTGSGL